MNGPILTSRFNPRATPDWQFSKAPRLTMREAFHAMSPLLPAQANIVFDSWNSRIITDIYPFCAQDSLDWADKPEPTHLAYQYHPAHKSMQITRIHIAGDENRHQGTGSALIASQLPFWKKIGIESVSVKAHEMSRGFYARLGFEDVPTLPEEPFQDYNILTLMRLDFKNPRQYTMFRQFMDKAPSLPLRPLPL